MNILCTVPILYYCSFFIFDYMQSFRHYQFCFNQKKCNVWHIVMLCYCNLPFLNTLLLFFLSPSLTPSYKELASLESLNFSSLVEELLEQRVHASSIVHFKTSSPQKNLILQQYFSILFSLNWIYFDCAFLDENKKIGRMKDLLFG